VTISAEDLFHPDVVARSRAHERHCRDEAAHKGDEPCPAEADPDDLEAIWAGRARMAWARVAAGVAVDRIDQEAIERYPK
jgi:hypothetical protein